MSDVPGRTFRRRGLGRGLEALLAATPAEEGDQPALVPVDPRAVKPNPEQPRRDFDEGSLSALGESIRLHGLLHPIVVQREGDGFVLIAGERRLRAAMLAGVSSIPAIVRPAAESSRQALEMALTENLMRTDLNPIEEAAAYARLADTFGLSHEAIGLRLGRGRPTISNAIRLLGLAAPVQQAVAEGRLTVGHAKALLGITDIREQQGLAAEVEARGMNVRDTEQAVQRRLDSRNKAPAAPAQSAAVSADIDINTSPDDVALQRGFETVLGLPVRLLRRRRGGGDLTIHFADDEDLDALYRKLNGPPL